MKSPGEYIQDYIKFEYPEKGKKNSDHAEMTYGEQVTASNMGMSLTDFRNLLRGALEITPDIADKLSDEIGSTSEYWLNLQKRFAEQRGDEFER